MPTYTWSRTREQLRDMILRRLGVIGAAETAAPEDSAIVFEAMDARLKELHSLGLLWWQVTTAQTTVALTASTATATIAEADFLFPVSAAVMLNGEERPVDIVSHSVFQAIPNKAQTGDVEMARFFGSTVYLWPVPRANADLKITYHALAADTETGAVVDIPVSMTRAFADLVAGDLASEYAVPMQKMQALELRRNQAERTIRVLSKQRVDSETVQPEWF